MPQYHLTDDQAQIREIIGRFLVDQYGHEARERIKASPGHWSPDIWHAFGEELGLLGYLFPERAGGMGGDAVDALLIMDAFGEALVVEPFLETCVIGSALLKESGTPAAEALMVRAVEGSARFSIAFEQGGARYAPLACKTKAKRCDGGYVISGGKVMVVGAMAATHLFVSCSMEGETGIGIFVVEADRAGLTHDFGQTLDGKSVSQLQLDDCAVTESDLLIAPSRGPEVLEQVLDIATAAICAEAVGIMRRLLRDTLAYTSQRRQFGSALIDFQVLQHRLADMKVGYEEARAMAFFAAAMTSDTPEHRRAAISAAKIRIGEILGALAREAVQMHGAMGMTDELAIGHLFRRATAIEAMFGSTDYHMARLARHGLPTQSLARSIL
ncbi:acyl-CoA dehydrogenase family protein [Sphingobium sp. CR2-8]|uniref:acyl-CoA dehydrogenase family protein n=1 Tax=Sphingobium sp. CR2-8 TaxID=1306534 RepID=UPI002DBCC0DA|nr:acyl-CoA dehydrogenase family protein [Sphingobium sp. CR2-8]MEC3911878.1 acyl-CoA dehydrogenase family protein [Sphingobium sp. CR2-8]